MSEFFKNNPIALNHCILYKFIQGKMSDEALAKLSRQKGNGSEAFDFRSCRFKQEYFDEKESIADVRKIIRSDKHALRACILSEALECRQLKNIDNGKRFSSSCYNPSSNLYENFRERIKDDVIEYTDFDAWFFEYADYSIGHEEVYMKYRKFCKVIGDDIMKFAEFEYWFYRFFYKDFDLNCERKEDKKIYELEDMPIDIMKNIVEYLDIFDRVALIKTSRSLQAFIEDQKLFHDTLELNPRFYDNCIKLGGKDIIQYTGGLRSNCEKQITANKRIFRGLFQRKVRRIRNVPMEKQILLDFQKILKYPKIHIDNLKIENVGDEFIAALEFPELLHVESIDLYSPELLMKILPCLKPGYLTTIDMGSIEITKEVVEMEQWKQAKHFEGGCSSIDDPLRHLYHFRSFSVLCKKLSVEDIRQLKEILSKSPDFRGCIIRTDDPVDAIKQEFGDPIPGSPDVYHFPIPNPSQYFEIKVRDERIEIRRKKI